jgi:hypothetical protein
MVGNAFSAHTPINPEKMGSATVNVCVDEKFVSSAVNALKF